ncbi:MAG: hypothetical protein WD934_09795 [Gemmatimonadales bacterium]
MVARTNETPLPGTLAFRFHPLPRRVERRRTSTNDMTLYDEKGQALGRVRAVTGEPEFGPFAQEVFLDRGI